MTKLIKCTSIYLFNFIFIIFLVGIPVCRKTLIALSEHSVLFNSNY